VEVASPTTHVQDALNRLKLLLFLLLPFTVILTSLFAGEFLVSITLKPLKSMIRTVQGITAENLEKRLALPETRDEIRQLAETFNEMLDKLHMAFSSQRRFLQDLSHEMRTPLTVLRGELDVALKRDRTSDQYKETLKSNLEEIDKISRLLDGLLGLARLENEAGTMNFEPVGLVDLVRDTIADFDMLARQKGIEVGFLASGEIVLALDRGKMRRVLINLLDNAVKFTPAHGVITITVTRGPLQAQVTVSDTGVGISPENLPHVFDRLFHIGRDPDGRGMGLGLSIAKTIVEAHRGTISCESTPGAGTTFTIRLPMGDETWDRPPAPA
jgi:heavy metal sensor kinase